MGQLDFTAAQAAFETENAGAEIPRGRTSLSVYHAGTDIKAELFADYHLTSSIANPVCANAQHGFSPAYVVDGQYRIVLETAKGDVLYQTDDVTVTTLVAVPPSDFTDVQDLIADLGMSYDALSGERQVQAGERIFVRDGGYSYEVAAPGAPDADVISTGGIGLYVRPMPDGAVSDRQFSHITNDADRLNAVIEWSIKRQKAGFGVPKIVVSGEYTMDKPIKAFDFDGTDYRHVSVHIEGPAQGYVGHQRTKFTFTDGQNPGVVTQKIRQLTLKNVAIVGAANRLLLPSHIAMLTRNGWWNTEGAVEDGQWKMHAGICVDPFYSGMATDQRFSHFDGSGDEPNHYTAGSGSGSTQILVENCDVQGWVVGVMCAASPVQIGDSITISKCNLSYNRWPFFIGESQNRGCVIADCHAKGFDTLMVGGSGVGAGTGSLCYIRGGVFVYGHSIVAGDVERGNGACTDAYFESIWAIGHIDGVQGFTFKDTQIKLLDAETLGLPDVDAQLTGTGCVQFLGGYIGKYRGGKFGPKLYCRTFINGATFDGMPSVSVPSNHTIQYMDHLYSGYGPTRQHMVVDNVIDPGAVGNAKMCPGVTLVDKYGDIWTSPATWMLVNHGTGVATVAGDGTASVTGLDLATLTVGDQVGVVNAWTGLDNRGQGFTHRNIPVGIVGSIDGGTVNLIGVSLSFPSGTYSFRTYRMQAIHRLTFGDTTSGSPDITNCSTTGSWRVGDFITGSGIPKNTRVTAISGTTITINQNATATATGIEILDASFRLRSKLSDRAPTSGTYHSGAFVTNEAPVVEPGGAILTGWVCTAGGSPGTWQPVYMATSAA